MREKSLLRISALAALGIGIFPGVILGSALALPEQRLLIELSQCRIDISTSDSESPGLRVLRSDGSEVSMESAGIAVKKNVVKLRQDHQQGANSDLVFSFTLLPSQDYQVEGEDVELTVTSPDMAGLEVVEDGGDNQLGTDTDGCSATRILNLTGGTVHMIGGGCVRIDSNQTDITLERTSRTLEVQATGGSIAVHDHLGKFVLNGQSEAIAVVHRQQGSLDAELSQSRLSTVEGSGSVTCRALDHSFVEVTDHQGPLNFSGSSSATFVQGGRETNLSLTGADLQTQISGGQGRVRATLEGGSLTIEDWVGRIDLQSSWGTTLDIDSVDGDFALSVNEAQGEISGVTGHTRGNLMHSKLDFSNLKSIDIVTDGSEVFVEKVRLVTQMAISGGHLEYEAFGVEGNPNISLLAEASITIVLPQPCVIRCTGPGAQDMGKVSVSGCEFRTPDQPWGRRPRQAEPAIQLQVEMQENTEVYVSGY